MQRVSIKFKHEAKRYVLNTNLLSSFLFLSTKDLYSKKDMKLVFSRFISRGEILCYSR